MKFMQSRNGSLAIILLCMAASAFALSRDFFTLGMRPEDTMVAIQSFDGYAVMPWQSAALSVSLCCVCIAWLSKSSLRKWVLAIAIIAFVGIFASTLTVLLSENTFALRDEIERATGIASNHGLNGIELTINIGAYLVLATTGCASLALAYALSKIGSWAVSTNSKRHGGPPVDQTRDTIGLWDSQR